MKIVVEITDADARDITRLIDLANGSEANTHGQLTVETLVQMLLEDVALTIRRPGCWEAANMDAVLSSHGYEV